MNKLKTLWFFLGIAACVLIIAVNPSGLDSEGVKCLALSAMAVIWWATGAMPSGYSAAMVLACLALFLDSSVVPPTLIFRLWTSPNMYMLIGGLFLAQAVEVSGLGARLSQFFLNGMVKSYRSLIISCYVLQVLLSIFIPHPWSRSFLLMSVMKPAIKNAGLDKKYAANVGLAVFAGSVPSSLILLTGDSSINNLVSSMSGVSLSYAQWALYLAPIGILATVLTCVLQLFVFGSPAEFKLKNIKKASSMTPAEKKVLLLLVVAVLLWATDGITGISPGWVALMCAGCMALPFVGVLDSSAFKKIPFDSLLFVTAAVALGTACAAVGIDVWLVDNLLPANAASSIWLFALIAVSFCVLVHTVLGSMMTAVNITGPAIVAFGAAWGVDPLVCSMLAFISVAIHWLLPFHHMSILVGMGEENGDYTDKQALKLGAVQTVVVYVVCFAGILWWKMVM